MTTDSTIEQEVYSVSQLNATARQALEALQTVWISGEISNLARPSSGHLYFSLKDANAQVRCAFFRHLNRRLDVDLENGQQVLVYAKVSLYEPRGDYQLIVAQVQLAGDGALQIAFEKLKRKLAAAGLFDEAHKKPLPTMPQRVGVITSASGAALHDILTVLNRRFPLLPVMIYPTQVQGATAANQITQAIDIANQRNECDVLILGRGGGSLEDLWCFNEEIVAHAIYKSTIPIVTGIGHEVDFTIADFVADHRAATPSAAAETVSPNASEWQDTLSYLFNTLKQQLRSNLRHKQRELIQLQKRLRHPGERLRDHAQRIDQLEQRLSAAWQYQCQHYRATITELARTLHAISPLNTLQRGYAILRKPDNSIVRSITAVTTGDKLLAKLQDGELHVVVDA